MPTTEISQLGLASLDGVLAPAEETYIPVTDEGLLRGDGVFEVVRLYSGKPFALQEHLARLASSAERLKLPIQLSQIAEEIDRLLVELGNVDGLLRVLVTRGGRRIVISEPLPVLPDTLRLATVTYSPTRLLNGVKSLSYAANMLATRLAREDGYDEALLVTPHGRVLEAPTAAFFWVSAGQLFTPPLSDGILASITRGRVMKLRPCVESSCTLDDLADADEVFLASSLRETLPVTAIDRLDFAAGPVALEVGAALAEEIRSELQLRP